MGWGRLCSHRGGVPAVATSRGVLMANWTRGYIAADGERAHARDAWPKGAVPASVLMMIISLGVCLWGIGRAAQQSTLSLGIVAAGAVAGLVAGYLAIKAVTDRWLAGDRDDAFA